MEESPESHIPCCNSCGCQEARVWLCEGCVVDNKEKSEPAPENKDTINLEWSSQKKHTPATKLYQDSARNEDSPASFGDYLEVKQDQRLSKRLGKLAQSGNAHEVHYMFCRYHDEPLSFYCTETKEILCSCCLFDKGILSKNYRGSKLRGQGLLPLKASIDLVKTELREIMTELVELSSSLEQNIRICVRSMDNIKQHDSKVCDEIQQVTQIMMEEIRVKEKQTTTGVKVALRELLEEYEEKEVKLREVATNSQELKFLSSKSGQLRSDQLAYLFQSAKELRSYIGNGEMKVDAFDPSVVGKCVFNRRHFKEQLDRIFSQPFNATRSKEKEMSLKIPVGNASRVTPLETGRDRNKNYGQTRR